MASVTLLNSDIDESAGSPSCYVCSSAGCQDGGKWRCQKGRSDPSERVVLSGYYAVVPAAEGSGNCIAKARTEGSGTCIPKHWGAYAGEAS